MLWKIKLKRLFGIELWRYGRSPRHAIACSFCAVELNLCAHDAVMLNVSAPCYLCCAKPQFTIDFLIAQKCSLRSIYRIERNFRRMFSTYWGALRAHREARGAVSSIIYDSLCFSFVTSHEIYAFFPYRSLNSLNFYFSLFSSIIGTISWIDFAKKCCWTVDVMCKYR